VSAGDDAPTALRLLCADPKAYGGVWLRGDSGWALALLAEFGIEARRVPGTIDEEGLSGGLDLAASLANGRTVRREGLIRRSWDDILLIAGAERMPVGIATCLAQARDEGGPALILLDEGLEPDLRPPAALLERVAFYVGAAPDPGPSRLDETACDDREVFAALASCAASLGVDSTRAAMFALRAARGCARLAGRARPVAGDVATAARLVLLPRALRLPETEQEPPAPEPQSNASARDREMLEDVVLDSVRAALPAQLLAGLAERNRRAGSRATHGKGARRQSGLRGRPVGARPGIPRGGARLALVDTLRAAVPWQKLRVAPPGAAPTRLNLRKEDLRIRRHQDRETSLTIFAVDASGSAAASRLGEAKGAVELLLQRAYAKRAEVALVAFRGEGAQALLPPTRSLTRARRLLAELPGGGGTPIAAGLDGARALAEAGLARGRTPTVVVLSDGRANIATDGRPGRAQAQSDATASARRLSAGGFACVFIDIGPRRQPEAAALAVAMAARYIHLPRADASAIGGAL
jgi:magnesium chelatase subunit D